MSNAPLSEIRFETLVRGFRMTHLPKDEHSSGFCLLSFFSFPYSILCLIPVTIAAL